MKKNGESWRQAVQDSYQAGYKAGWRAYEQVPKRFGTYTAVKSGFSKGISSHKKSDTYIARSGKPVKAQ